MAQSVIEIGKATKTGYIDVGDGCWRPNVLVTSHVVNIAFWRIMMVVTDVSTSGFVNI